METINILKKSFDNRGGIPKSEKSIRSRKSSKGSKKSVSNKRKPSLTHNLSSVQDLRYKHIESCGSNKSLKSGIHNSRSSNCVLLADGSMS